MKVKIKSLLTVLVLESTTNCNISFFNEILFNPYNLANSQSKFAIAVIFRIAESLNYKKLIWLFTLKRIQRDSP